MQAKICRLALLSLCMFTASLVPAQAHDPSLSAIRVIYRPNDVVVNVTTHISRLQKSDGGHSQMTANEIDRGIRRRLHLRFGKTEMTPENAHVILDQKNDLISWQTILTPRGTECDTYGPLYPEDKSARTVFSIIKDGAPVKESILSPAQSTHKQNNDSSASATAVNYLREGILHILSGPDHIVFLLGLLLLGGSFGSLLRIVTAFTLAHSITFSLAATGTFNPAPRIVEPLIALSIVAIALENLRSIRGSMVSTKRAPARDWRPWVAFGFGLIHGFGFAGALTEVGMPNTEIWVPLASFNVGIEVGQACIVIALCPALTWLARRRPQLSRKLVVVASCGIATFGIVWFIQRLVTP